MIRLRITPAPHEASIFRAQVDLIKTVAEWDPATKVWWFHLDPATGAGLNELFQAAKHYGTTITVDGTA